LHTSEPRREQRAERAACRISNSGVIDHEMVTPFIYVDVLVGGTGNDRLYGGTGNGMDWKRAA